MSTSNPDGPPEHKNDFFSPRAYQVELLDKAIKKNTIVQLGTGSGKTFIAVLLIKEFTVQLRLPLAENGRRAFFVVNAVALVDQQAEHIEVHTALSVGRAHGNLNTDIWTSKAAFDAFFQAHHVVVMTAQVLYDLLCCGYLKFPSIALMIFDECHHALGGNHPYRKIMDLYLSEPKEVQPRILGLTASLINDKTDPDTLEKKLYKLERILDCDIETSCDLVSVSKYGARPKEHVIKCKNYRYNNPYSSETLRLLESVKEFCSTTQEFHPELDKDVRKSLNDALTKTISVIKQLGPWTALKVAGIRETEFKFMKRHTKIFGVKQKDFLALGETTMNTVRRLLEPKMKFQKIQTLFESLPDKVVNLLQALDTYHPDKQMARKGKVDHLSGIVFVEQRYIAFALHLVLKHAIKLDPDRFGFINPDYVIGNSSNSLESKASEETHKRLEKVLLQFRKGQLNLLIATNVLEEGVDVKHCNLVVKFDRPTNFRSYIQSRGRARKSGASYLVLVEEKDAKNCADDLADFAKIEKLLLNRAKTVHNPSEGIELTSIDDLIPPYFVEKSGAKLFLSNAIQLINKYCGKLPSDVFTRLVPQCRLLPSERNGMVVYGAELLLPMNSPLKTAIYLDENEAVSNKKLAQMLVAFKACQELHKIGELNDHLLPVGKVEAMLSLLDDDPDENTDSYAVRVGSMKRKQLYDKKTASVLQSALPREDEELLLYVLDIDLIVPLPPDEIRSKKREILNPKTAEMCFGFLSRTKIPKIPPFPAFLRQGESRVNIVLSPKTLTLDDETLTYLKLFHHYIFRSVLQLTKDCLEFRLDEATPLQTIIVPLDRITGPNGSEEYSLKMEYVREVVHNMEEMPRVPKEDDRKHFKFVASEWEDRVVMPWYRNVQQPTFFYVIDIHSSQSPSSPFPDDDFNSFNEYFKKKYNLEIYDQQQSLLEVEYTSNRLNLLLPRHRPSRQRTTKSGGPSNQKQIFVPELLDRHPISARLWHSISAIPAFFYRMNALLVADEIRARIMREAIGLSEDEATPTDEWMWKPLAYPTTAEERSQTMVTKLNQLRVDKEEYIPSKKRKGGSSIASGHSEKQFEIGVWDPALAAEFVPDDAAIKKVDGWLEETAGLHGTEIPQKGGDLSDDEENYEHALYFDRSNFIRDSLRHIGMPSDDVQELGWGELPSEIVVAPFMILDGGEGSQINLNGLMADIEKVLPSTSPPSSPKEEVTTTAPGDTKYIPKQLLELWDGPVEVDDDREKGRKEEVIDLIAFDNDVEPLRKRRRLMKHTALNENIGFDSKSASPTAREEKKEGTIDDELSQLERGEEEKARRDHEAAMIVSEKEIKEGEVLASPLADPRFSFHHPSRSVAMGGYFIGREEGAVGEEKAPFGVSPSLILAALTTSNANDGMNLERLETIGDSFLKYTVTDFLFHSHPDLHEGKLSFARSKEVSNCNLYRLGKKIGLPSIIIGSKFDVQDGWLPPCYVPSINFKAPNNDDAEKKDEIMERMLNGEEMIKENIPVTGWDERPDSGIEDGVETINLTKPAPDALDDLSPLPYNLLTQQYISDKCIADSVEALIGAHLLSLGPQRTLQMMKWLGLKVMTEKIPIAPPLLRYIDTPLYPHRSEEMLTEFFAKFQLAQLEEKIGYRFNNKAYLLQAFTHASYYPNRITGCYQRLEFLGDAVLDYMITRFLFEHEKQYSPGVLTDLRSALVNNTIFASLAVKYDFHKHFVAMCPGLHFMIEKFVKLCRERNFLDANFHCEMYMVTTEDEIDEGQEEDVEVPKAMGDIFESVAGAIYLDCGGDLDVVWRVFFNLMRETIEECCRNPPRSPVRELLEREHDKAKFSKLERIMEKGKVRVTVEIVSGKENFRFTGMGRNYRIAKTTAAKRALKHLKGIDEDRRKKAERKKQF
ncbi:dcr-1 [Pristionchus pacificus]|uniref:Dcr-1 n=1 Tax=Pristionchus pacificus TaxID=54126 RepID=A0A2A6BB24_PRIPA|nr:dcr-1 [Pristionchus pacificus]|eukprot:PDM63051.1 dcr-1 [Pristionchus pacificus]